MSFPSAPPPPAPSKSSPATIVAIFVGAMLLLAVLAVVFIVFNQPSPPTPPCEPGQACAPKPSLPPVSPGSPLPSSGPTPVPTTVPATLPPGATATPFVPPTDTPNSNSPAVLSGTLWQSATLNFSFEYDPESWTLADETADTAVFSSVNFDAQVVIHAVAASTSVDELIAQQLSVVDSFLIGRVKDTDDYDALLGPSTGYVNGQGDVYSGTLLSSDGTPVAPGGVTVLAATDGRLTVSVVVIVGSPDAKVGSDTQQHAARKSADKFLKTFDWDTR
jgi:hypothetical protein